MTIVSSSPIAPVLWAVPHIASYSTTGFGSPQRQLFNPRIIKLLSWQTLQPGSCNTALHFYWLAGRADFQVFLFRVPTFRPTPFRPKPFRPILLGQIRLGQDWTKRRWTKMNWTKSRSTVLVPWHYSVIFLRFVQLLSKTSYLFCNGYTICICFYSRRETNLILYSYQLFFLLSLFCLTRLLLLLNIL